MEWIGMAAVVVTNTICLTVCFVSGARIGQRVSEGKEVAQNPITAIERRKAQKEFEEAEEERKIMMENIDSYDGTEIGQRDV